VSQNVERLMSDSYEFDSQSAPYVEWLWQEFLHDPGSVPREWQEYFRTFDQDGGVQTLRPAFRARSVFNPLPAANGARHREDQESERLQHRADQLMRAYRVRGHLLARLGPAWSRARVTCGA
jgi:2-oxoglutarate dehydrogenase E1 component